MSFFLTYAADSEEYVLKPAGYGLLIVLLAALLLPSSINWVKHRLRRSRCRRNSSFTVPPPMALAVVNFLHQSGVPALRRFCHHLIFHDVHLPDRLHLWSQNRTDHRPGLRHPAVHRRTVYLRPASGASRLSAGIRRTGTGRILSSKKHGLIIGYLVGIVGRYICHVLSGYIFFAAYAPEGMNPFFYTLGYNATYIVPEAIATVLVFSLPPVAKAIAQVKKQAISS